MLITQQLACIERWLQREDDILDYRPDEAVVEDEDATTIIELGNMFGAIIVDLRRMGIVS